jgi:hypothetical protein
MELRKYVILFVRNKREENQRNLKQLKRRQTPLKQKSQLLNQRNFNTDSSSDDDSSLDKKQVTLLLSSQSWQMTTYMKTG